MGRAAYAVSALIVMEVLDWLAQKVSYSCLVRWIMIWAVVTIAGIFQLL